MSKAVDYTEPMACHVDGGVLHTAFGSSRQPSVKIARPSISKPAVRERGDDWLDSEEVTGFRLPPHRLHSSNAPRNVRYIADGDDEVWLRRVVGSGKQQSQGRGKTGSNAGPISTAASKPAAAGLVTVLEDVFTDLESQAFLAPALSVDRLTVRSSLKGGHSADFVEQCRLYWLSKRMETGLSMPLIPAFTPNVSEESQPKLISSEMVAEFPLPFHERDWTVGVLRRSNTNGESASKRRRYETERLSQDAVALCDAMVQRDETYVQSLLMTVYELASLRSSRSVEPLPERVPMNSKVVDFLLHDPHLN